MKKDILPKLLPLLLLFVLAFATYNQLEIARPSEYSIDYYAEEIVLTNRGRTNLVINSVIVTDSKGYFEEKLMANKSGSFEKLNEEQYKAAVENGTIKPFDPEGYVLKPKESISIIKNNYSSYHLDMQLKANYKYLFNKTAKLKLEN
ncbi:MAG: hypothetical protein GXZ11_00040 [Tissierellia bacterium]|nr:hypothetical protein [Tissierellia bacterium]